MAEVDTEFYLRRIAKCRAVPESERGADVRALLEAHELLEAAVADLPLPGSAAPQPSSDAVSVARARYLRVGAVRRIRGAPARCRKPGAAASSASSQH